MKDELNKNGSTSLSENFTSSAQRTIIVDVEKYDEYMRDTGMSPEQKEEFLRAMWTVVMTFVELGFGVHPLQQVGGQEIGGKAEKCADQRPKAALDEVSLGEPKQDKTTGKARPSGRLEAK